MPLPVDEREFIAKYGELPTSEQIKQHQAEHPGVEKDWEDYWTESDKSVDMLERLYMFWMLRRGGVEWPQARASSDDG